MAFNVDDRVALIQINGKYTAIKLGNIEVDDRVILMPVNGKYTAIKLGNIEVDDRVILMPVNGRYVAIKSTDAIPPIIQIYVNEHPVRAALYVDSNNNIYILTYDQGVDPTTYYFISGASISKFSTAQHGYRLGIIAFEYISNTEIYGYVTDTYNYGYYNKYRLYTNKIEYIGSFPPIPTRFFRSYNDVTIGNYRYVTTVTRSEYNVLVTLTKYLVSNNSIINSISSTFDVRDYQDNQNFDNGSEYGYNESCVFFIHSTETAHVITWSSTGWKVLMYIRLTL